MSEYQIDIKIRNGLILSKIKELGYKSTMNFCKKNNLCVTDFYKILNLKLSPLGENGNFRQIIYDACNALKCSPEDIFTQNQLNLEITNNKRTLLVNEAEMQFMLSNSSEQKSLEAQVLDDEFNDALISALDILTAREKKIITMRYGIHGVAAHTLEEISKIFDISITRIRDIETKALRKLRQHKLTNRLEEFYEE